MKPLVIIGAGRSGTNILRDTLTRLDGFGTWDCDEINLIWRHGNTRHPHDVFGPQQARPEVATYLRSAFASFQARSGSRVVVEKTCANSLRVPFIDAVFPEARYVYIVRDGRDVALSAAKRWTASIEPKYLLKKLKYAPLSDLPRYGLRFVRNRLSQMRSKDRRQAIWGPVFPGMAEIAASKPLLEVCAMQWAACVDHSDSAFNDMSAERVFQIRYEDMVRDPASAMNSLADWYEPGLSAEFARGAFDNIHAGSANGWKKQQDQFTQSIDDILAPVLKRHGYSTST